jgi:hypothetical protein
MLARKKKGRIAAALRFEVRGLLRAGVCHWEVAPLAFLAEQWLSITSAASVNTFRRRGDQESVALTWWPPATSQAGSNQRSASPS